LAALVLADKGTEAAMRMKIIRFITPEAAAVLVLLALMLVHLATVQVVLVPHLL
jgi:hypothetical protein